MIIDSTGGNKVTYGETKEYKTTMDIERFETYEVEICYVYEDTQGISADEFNWKLGE